MLKAIKLENYKCFKDETIDIAPLTVLCGVNSSGKSSILKSLLMMKQTVEKDTPYNKLAFSGKYVDNGYFDDIINITCKDNCNSSFTISNVFVLNNFNGIENRQDIASFKELKKMYYFIKNINSFEISHSVTVKKITKEQKTNPFLVYIGNNMVVNCKITIYPKDKNDKIINKSVGAVEITKVGNTEQQYYINYFNIPCNGKMVSIFQKNYRCYCYFNNIKLTNIYQENMNMDIIEAKSTILSFFNIASMQYGGFDFIAPLRQAPMRNYIINGDVNSVGIAGEDTPILLAKLKDNTRIKDIPSPHLEGNEYHINFQPIRSQNVTFLQHIQEWMNYFDLGKIDIKGDFGLLSLNINNHNIADVGFGVSQILPIIVQGIHMQKDASLLLEQPEIHLHPQMQMRMADLLLALASTERNVIVETHSDHIINRLVHRIMEDDSNNLQSLIKIYFFKNDGKNSEKQEITINKLKGIINAPVEFFGQYATEIDEIMRIGFKNMKARKKQDEQEV